MLMPDSDTIAKLIRETAQAEIVPRFRALERHDIREKGPGDFVTLADIETERQLTRRLLEAAPDSVVLGEEAAADDPSRFALLAGDAPVWIIDPVDGTANFARGQPGFGVIVARVQHGEVRSGWIYDPLADVMVTAEAGEGAWSAGQRLSVAKDAIPAEMVGAAYGRTIGGSRASEALTKSGRIGGVRNHGCSALEYMAIAFGRAQFALHSRSLPWDHAAGMLIVAEAGGVSTFLDGSPYDPRIADRAVLAASDREAWDTVRAIIAALA
jgi:fructose-1,6-bisphosphatase/inositol monophosphatase family enzyme